MHIRYVIDLSLFYQSGSIKILKVVLRIFYLKFKLSSYPDVTLAYMKAFIMIYTNDFLWYFTLYMWMMYDCVYMNLAFTCILSLQVRPSFKYTSMDERSACVFSSAIYIRRTRVTRWFLCILLYFILSSYYLLFVCLIFHFSLFIISLSFFIYF